MLELREIDSYYGRVQILRRISMKIATNTVATLLGGNASGKSTTLRTISGIIVPKSGEIIFKDQKINGRPTDLIFKRGIVYIPQDRQLFSGMTVAENMELGAIASKGLKEMRQDFERVFHYFPILRERLSQKAKTLSGGESSMLAIGRALMSNPQLLLMDEPSSGLAPQMVAEMAKLIMRLRYDGLTILLVEQNVRMALSLSTTSFVLRMGEVVYSGDSSKLLIEEIYQVYFGS